MHPGPTRVAASLILVLASSAPVADEARHPVPATPLRALPSLESSDPVVRGAILKVRGAGDLAPMLVPGGIIRRFVGRVDEVARGTRGACPRALAAIADIDAKAAATLYSRMYPLLQQAYDERSPKEGYFNDRLVEAIDHLLADNTDAAAPVHAKLREMRALLAMTPPGR